MGFDHSLALKRPGLRFVSTETEKNYLDWRLTISIPVFQVTAFIALILFSLILPAMYGRHHETFGSLSPILVATAVNTLALLIVLRLGIFKPLYMPWGSLTCACATVALVSHRYVFLNYASLDSNLLHASGSALVGGLFGLCLLQLRPRWAWASALPGILLVSYFAFSDFQAGRLSSQAVSGTIGFMLTGLIAGGLTNFFQERRLRHTFASEQMITRQQHSLENSQKAIRRYIPATVAEQIISGNEAGISEPKRQRITVLFSDIVGFTDIADRVEPEVMTEVLNDYMSSMADLIEQHGGTLNEFAGDGLMALFGAPNEMAPEDQAKQSISSARAMQAKMPELNEQWRKLGLGAELEVRIGINTGMVSVGSYGSQGRMTYTAIGLQTNIASRIESKANPGQILMSDATYQLISDDIACKPKGEVDCKGVHFPVKVYAPPI